MLVATLCVAWATNAQNLGDYRFSTGTDASKWITLTSNTNLLGTGNADGRASSLQNIGFTFPFGEGSYTQFSVNSDGNLRLGSTVTGTSNYTTPFSSTNSNSNGPKINFLGCDGYFADSIHYVYAENTVDANDDSLLVVEFCLGTYTTATRYQRYKWQVHLYPNGDITAVIAATAPVLTPAVANQKGLCYSPTNGVVIGPGNQHYCFHNGSTIAWPVNTWPAPNTYYTFVRNYTCTMPSAITLHNVGTTTATLSFTPTGTATTWIASISPAIMGMSSYPTNDTMASLMFLTPNTEYMVRVRTLCGAGDTSNAQYFTFHTRCTALTAADLPYTEDFEDYGSGSSYPINSCWFKGTNNSTAYPYPYSTNAITGSRSLYFYSYRPSSATAAQYYCYAALPELDASVDVSSLTLRFNSRRYSSTTSTYHSLIQVGVMSDPEDTSTFELVQVVDMTSQAALAVQANDIDFSSYTGTGKYIALFSPVVETTTTAYNYIYIDDIELLPTPTCFRPTNVTASNITTTEATITWTPDATNGNNFVVAYGMGNDPATMPQIAVTGDSVRLTGLNHSSTYNVYVKAICDTNDQSEFSIAGTFNTACAAVSLPFSEDFDSYTTSTTSTTGVEPNCWTIAHKDVTWSLASNNPQIYYGSSNAHSGNYSLRLYYRCIYALPEMDANINELRMTFWVKQTSSNYRLVVGVMDNLSDETSFVPIDTIICSSTSASEEHVVNFNGYTGTGRFIAFRNINGPSTSYSYSYNYIDDVLVEQVAPPVPVCVPTTWTTGDSTGNGYYTPVNNYYKYTLTETLITAEEIGGPMRIDTISYHYMHSSPMTDKTDVTIWLQPTTKTEFSSTSDIDLLDSSIAVQVFSGAMNFSQGWNDIVLPEPYFLDGTSNLMVIVDDNSNDYNSNSHKFSTAACTGYKTITWYSDSQNPDPVTGNNSVTESAFSGSKTRYQYRVRMALKGCDLSTCRKPNDLAVSNITATSATLNWSDNNDGATYTVVNLADSTIIYSGVTAGNLTMNNLTPETSYALGVYANCSADDSSFMTTVSFATPASCVVPTNFVCSGFTTTTATLTWVDNNSNATYTIYNMNDSSVVATGINGYTYTVSGLTANTSYTFGLVANCSADDVSGVVTTSVYTGYCQPTPTSMDGDGIVNVSFGGMTNTNHPTSAGYADYTSMSGTVPAGTTATVNITYSTSYSYGTIIWVDWNNNMVFDGDEVAYVGESDDDDPTTLTATFSIPASQAPGSYRMRIVGADSYFDSYTSSIAAAANANPCASYSWGVAEDYTLTVTAMPNCLPVTNLTAEATTYNVTLNWSDDNNTGATYTVYNMSDTSVVATGITGYTYNVTGLTANTQYTFAVVANCSADDASDPTTVTVSTLCTTFSLPFTEDFAASSSSRACWTLDYPESSNAITYVTLNGNDMLRFSSYSYASDYNQYAYSPILTPTPGTDSMGIRIRYATYGSSDQLWFGYRTADTNDYVWSESYTTSGSSDMQYFTATVPGNTVQLGFHYYGSYAYYAWIDSVDVWEYATPEPPTPVCVPITWTTGDSTGNGYYTPVNDYYKYTLSETIITAEEIGGPMRIDTISYHYMYSTPMSSKTDVTIWLQPTTKSAFSSSSDIDLLDSSIAVQIFSDSMNFSQGWNDIALPVPYFFDGTTNLMVIVDDNSNDYDGSSYKFSTANCTGYKTISWYSDSQNPDPVNGNNSLTESAFTGSKAYYQYRVRMALKGCDMITCHKPTITSVTYDDESAVIYFAASDGGNYIATLTDGTTTSTVTTNDPMASFNNLLSNTVYTFSVRTICGNGDTSMAAVTEFRTNCGATLALPYTEDFSGYDNLPSYPYYGPSVTPSCWDYYSNGTNTVETSTTSAYYGGVSQYTSTGSYGCIEANNPYLYMPIQLTGANVTSSTYLNYGIQRGSVKYAVLPAFAQALNGLQISFDYKMSSTYSSTGAAATLELGYVTGDTSTFQSIQSYQATTTLQHVTDLNLSTLAASAPAGARLAFKFSGVHNGTGTSSYSNVALGIDNILVETLPTCSRVTNLAVSNVDINSVTLTWNDTLNTGATYTVYDMADTSVVATGITATTYTVTGLTSNTQYTFGVMANCSATDNSSMATVSTRTSCDVYQLPFTEDFSANLISDPCWRGATNTAENIFAGAPLILTTPSWSYASSVRDGIAAGHYYKNVYGSSVKSWMITPAIDLSTVTTAQLSFDVALTDYSNAALPDANGDTNTSQAFMVIVSPDGGNTWSAANATVWQNVGGDYTYASLADTVYQNKVINLDQYVGDTIKIAFYAQSLWSGGDNDLHLDNISVTGESLVQPGLHVTVASADSTMGTTIPAPGTYDFYEGDTMYFLAVANPGYQFVNWTATSFGVTDTSTINPIYSVLSANMIDMNVTLTANFEPVGNTCNVTIYAEDEYGDGWNGNTITIMQGTNTVGSYSMPDQGMSNTRVYDTVTFAVQAGIPVSFGWTTGSWASEVSFSILDGSGSAVYSCTDGDDLSDVVFFTLSDPCPTCAGVQNLAVSNITTNSATLVWTSDNNNATYTVYDMSDTSVIASGLTAQTYTITGLSFETNYQFGVAVNCSATESSSIATVNAFTGYCLPNPTSVDNSGITSVSFGGMTNTTHPTSAMYANYSSMSGNVPAGTTATVDITYATGYTYGTIIWVDWDNSLTFDGNEVVYVGQSESTNPTTLTATFEIPATQALGSYRMRILGSDSYFDSYTGSIAAAANANPCGSYSYGVAEDYTLNVTSMPSCLPINGLTATATYNSVTLSWIDTNNTGATYTVYDMSDTSVLASGLTATTYTATGLNSNSDYVFGVASNCSSTESSYITNVSFHTEMAPIMCGTDLASIYVNADSATGNTSYMPGYSLYNYSYTEVIVPASRLTGLGEIKGMAFEVANFNASAGQKFDNCEIYLMHTNATSLSDGFIQDSNNFQLVYSGTLNYESAGWRNVTFDNSFMYNGLSNVVVAVRRNHGSWTSGSSFVAYTDSVQVARYVYRDASAYTIGEITGGTATTTVPLYRLIGCESTLPAPVTINIASDNTTMGTTLPAPGTYTYNVGDSVSAAAVANPGYHFTYWVISFGILSDTIPFSSYSDVIPAFVSGMTLNLTAHFAANQYTVTASPNSPMMGTVTGSGTYSHGSTATLTAVPTTNTHFVQWNDGDTHATRTIVVTSDTAFTATFAYNPVTVTLINANPTMGTTNPVPGTYTFNLGDSIEALATANTGYHFAYWALNMAGATDTIMDNPIGEVIPNLPMFAGMNFTVTANFAPNQYTLTVAANDNAMGTVTGSGTYNYLDTVTITATPANHCLFVQWNDGNTNAVRDVVVTGDATYTATFQALPQYELTLTADPTDGGTMTGAGLYYAGETVTIVATPNDGYHFLGWALEESTDFDYIIFTHDPTYTFTMYEQNTHFYALFEEDQIPATVTVTINNADWGYVLINGVQTNNYEGFVGDSITLIAVANEGFHFVDWGDLFGGDTLTLVISTPDMYVTCNFAENVGIDDVVEDNTIIYSENSNIVVRGAEMQTIRVFDVIGRLVAQRNAAAVEETIQMPATGVYLVKIGDRPARRVVVRK